MRKTRRFSAGQVEDFLRNHKTAVPKSRIAKAIGCSSRTVGKKISILRRENNLPILPTGKGIVLREHVEKFPEAKEVIDCGKWILDTFVGMVIIAKVAQRPLLQAAKLALKKLPSDEQRLVKETMYKLAHFSSTAEIDGLLEEGEDKKPEMKK
jgi:hypothetical protein